MPKNWRTTLAGLVTNLLYLILSGFSAGGISIRDILLAAGLQTLATLAKDFNISHTKD